MAPQQGHSCGSKDSCPQEDSSRLGGSKVGSNLGFLCWTSYPSSMPASRKAPEAKLATPGQVRSEVWPGAWHSPSGLGRTNLITF